MAKAKARVVARGFSQREGIDYFETFAPTPAAACIRLLAATACELADADYADADYASKATRSKVSVLWSSDVWRRISKVWFCRTQKMRYACHATTEAEYVDMF